jgi:hypothetical protein
MLCNVGPKSEEVTRGWRKLQNKLFPKFWGMQHYPSGKNLVTLKIEAAVSPNLITDLLSGTV